VTPTTPPGSTTIAAAPINSNTSTPWGWIVVIVVVLLGALLTVLLVRRHHLLLAAKAWRKSAVGALDAAHLVRGLLPPSGEDLPNDAHWREVRDRVEVAAVGLERIGADAPAAEATGAANNAAGALRGLVFALESERLLHQSLHAPTARQLADVDEVRRTRALEADNALETLEGIVRPVGDAAV
jgi:hypothetical protein